MIHEAYSTPLPLQMQATTQSCALLCVYLTNRPRGQKADAEKKGEWRARYRNPALSFP